MGEGRQANTAEGRRLADTRGKPLLWRRWGPYFSERSWGTVREDYSPNGAAWDFLPHDMARSKAFRWGEDGLAAICDRYQLLVFSLALWNGRDPILKERAFGLTPGEGNHGEDVKEYYFYLCIRIEAFNRGPSPAPLHILPQPACGSVVVRLRLTQEALKAPLQDIDRIIAQRRMEADEFYAAVHPPKASEVLRENLRAVPRKCRSD